MRDIIFSLGLSTFLSSAVATSLDGDLMLRTLPAQGGWSLQMEVGGSCPAGTSTCFSDQTGVYSEFDRTGVDGTFSRGEECCPSGTTPRLGCGTYVNNGQPYACCPLGNADCRGDVEDPTRQGNEKCANSGWTLWQIPDGDYNMFCCLPDQYGYWYKDLGQDAGGMCSPSSVLPEGSTPAIQFNNGDGSVSPSGVQLSSLPSASATPAPTCDIVHYGWSLQVHDASGCTSGSTLCSYGGACCPSSLNCGTVIGDSEVPVCCPPHNPDCRGDVEGLWPQVCADSSWPLWHVNTNGNHFCCLPDQVGFNVPNDNTAVGFCGSAVPNGTMRSILDYVGDGSTPGSFAQFPCDSFPAPNASLPSIISQILNPPATLNPSGIALATGRWTNVTRAGTSPTAEVTVVKPWLATMYTYPPGTSETVAVVHSLSNGGPVTVTRPLGAVGTGAVREEGGATPTPAPSPSEIMYITTISGELVVATRTAQGLVHGGASSSGAAGGGSTSPGTPLVSGGGSTAASTNSTMLLSSPTAFEFAGSGAKKGISRSSSASERPKPREASEGSA